MASKRQYSFTLTPGAERALNRRTVGVRPNKSRIISEMVERYAWLVRGLEPLEGDNLQHVLRLTEGWELNTSVAKALTGLVAGADVPEDLSVKRSRLAAKIGCMDKLTLIAVIEQLERERGKRRLE